jgi:6-phosphogluconolactonase
MKSTFYVGTYTEDDSVGIYQCVLDMNTGKIDLIDFIENQNSPTFLALNPQKTYLYSCETIEDSNIISTVSSYKIDNITKKLSYINSVSSNGSTPAYVTVDNTGNHLLAINYGSGSVCSYKLNNDGSIGELISLIQHTGSSTHPTRQNEPHPHSINLDKDNKYAYVADLGTDKVVIYEYDKDTGKLSYTLSITTKSSEGPRHLAFSSDNNFIYLITELGNNIYVYKRDTNTLNEIQVISTLPDGYKSESYCAEITISPCGRYLYGSNRGHNSIVAYNIDKDSGKLILIDHYDCGGKIPRHFVLDKTGKFLVVANQLSKNISSFKIDSTTGKLIDTGFSVHIPNPTCIRFY